jgi:hypothetical protein
MSADWRSAADSWRLVSLALVFAVISRPLARLERKGIEIVHGEIDAIDPVGRSARVHGAPREKLALALVLMTRGFWVS